MSLSFLLGQEQTGRLYYVLCTYFIPSQLVRIFASRYTDSLAVNDKAAVLYIGLDSAFEHTVHGVILQHVCQIVNRAQVVDANDLNVITILGCAENETSDTAEAVNTNFCHKSLFFYC